MNIIDKIIDEEIFSLNEDPDTIPQLDLKFRSADALAFGMYMGKMYVSYNDSISNILPNGINYITHGSMNSFYNTLSNNKIRDLSDRELVDIDYIETDEYKYAGRLWYLSKVISFWEYPKTEAALNMVYRKLEEEIRFIYGRTFNLKEFKIEIYVTYNDDSFIDIIPRGKGHILATYDEYIDFIKYNFNFDHEPIQHVLSPLDKNKGKGMESVKKSNIEYLGKKFGKTPIAKYNFVKNTGIDEQLSESPDNIAKFGKNYDSVDAVPFGIYGKEMIVGYNPDLFPSSKKMDLEMFLKQKLEYIKEKGIETNNVINFNASDLVEYTAVHPTIFFFQSYLYDRGISKTNIPPGKYDRRDFKFGGRLWYLSKVISFWHLPKKRSDFMILLKLIKNSMNNVYGYNIDFNSYKIEVPIKSETNTSYKLYDMNDFIEMLDGETQYKASDVEMDRPHLMTFDDKQKSKQMQAVKKSNINFIGQKTGSVPLAKINFEKNRNIAESIEIMDNIINELLRIKDNEK